MVQIRNIDEANEALAAHVPITKELIGKDLTVDRMRSLMERLGNPQNDLKIIHIAGTSGKTSTAYYVAGLLTAAGQKVGLTVSPHMDSVTERLQINLQPLSEAEFCDQLAEFLGLIEGFDPKPSYFELIIAFVFWYCASQQVNYLVLETGLGGLHDSANIAQRADKVCVITDIGYDHMHILGKTLAEIAAQKAGIMHPGNNALMFDQGEEINQVVKHYADKQQASMVIIDEAVQRKNANTRALDELPKYQQRNWLLAYATYVFVAERDGLPSLTVDELHNSMEVYVPGRMDVRELADGTTLIMDGAHNEPKMKAFVESFQAKFPGVRAVVLMSLKEGKEYQDVLPLLKPITTQLLLTKFTQGQDLPSQPIDPQLLADEAKKLGFTDVIVEPDQQRAYKLLTDANDKLKIVTGSFYLLSQLRNLS